MKKLHFKIKKVKFYIFSFLIVFFLATLILVWNNNLFQPIKKFDIDNNIEDVLRAEASLLKGYIDNFRLLSNSYANNIKLRVSLSKYIDDPLTREKTYRIITDEINNKLRSKQEIIGLSIYNRDKVKLFEFYKNDKLFYKKLLDIKKYFKKTNSVLGPFILNDKLLLAISDPIKNKEGNYIGYFVTWLDISNIYNVLKKNIINTGINDLFIIPSMAYEVGYIENYFKLIDKNFSIQELKNIIKNKNVDYSKKNIRAYSIKVPDVGIYLLAERKKNINYYFYEYVKLFIVLSFIVFALILLYMFFIDGYKAIIQMNKIYKTIHTKTQKNNKGLIKAKGGLKSVLGRDAITKLIKDFYERKENFKGNMLFVYIKTHNKEQVRTNYNVEDINKLEKYILTLLKSSICKKAILVRTGILDYGVIMYSLNVNNDVEEISNSIFTVFYCLRTFNDRSINLNASIGIAVNFNGKEGLSTLYSKSKRLANKSNISGYMVDKKNIKKT